MMASADSTAQKLLIGVVMVLILYVIAVPFYMHFEGLNFLDAIYFVTVSITSAGYGDITPKTDIGKAFSILLLLSGVSIFFYHITHLGQFKERNIDPHVQRRIDMLRNLTMLQTGDVRSDEVKKIKDKIRKIQDAHEGKGQGFGRL
ncbi:MAG: potassium channel family protein [Candidatus ainarchaeum sp.]|nr:potassium channel family protein [Candidatus ainarchaeum sp.]